MLYRSALDLVGNTPLLELRNIMKKMNLKAHLYAKIEFFNPTGSVKDRPALKMIIEAEKSGQLKEDSTIIEPTSGNTGIGIASISAMKGYRCILTMPSSMSIERRKMLKAYGAEIVLTDPALGMKGAIAKAEELNKEIPNSIILGQFTNPNNPLSHYETTGPEIYKDLDGKVDMFVAGIGTGGTISGTGKYLKEKNPNIYIIGVEPSNSPVLSEGRSGKHKIQGIGAGFVPETLNTSIYDKIAPISDENALECARLMSQVEGLSVGISSGAALSAAITEALKEENKDKNIVVLLPDSGDRYLSTDLFIE